MEDKLKEILTGTKAYDFIPDPQEMLEQKGDVYFTMGLSINADPNKVRDAIMREIDTIGFCNYIGAASVLVGRTDPDTCEQYFNWRLQYKPSAKGATKEGYIELQPALIPIDLEDLVQSIELKV